MPRVAKPRLLWIPFYEHCAKCLVKYCKHETRRRCFFIIMHQISDKCCYIQLVAKVYELKSQPSYNSLNAILLVRHCYIWTPKDFQKFFFIIMIFIPYLKTHVGIALYTTKMWVSRRDIFRFPLITSILTESNTVRR